MFSLSEEENIFFTLRVTVVLLLVELCHCFRPLPVISGHVVVTFPAPKGDSQFQ